jgi:hypothetical protein
MDDVRESWRKARLDFERGDSFLNPDDEEEHAAILTEIGVTNWPCGREGAGDLLLGPRPTPEALERGAMLLTMSDHERAVWLRRHAGPRGSAAADGAAHSTKEAQDMSQILTQEGRFKARPRSWVVEENKNTGTLQLAMTFAIAEAWTGQAWEDWSPYDLEKTGYFYLAKKDGSPNEACIRSLREALSWDGVNLESLQNTDWTQKVVQITTGFEEYEGQQRLKIRYINAENWEGAQAKPLDAAALKALNARWGPKLRSIAPKGTPKPSPCPAPAPAQAAMATLKADPALDAAKKKAWAKIVETFGGDTEAARQNAAALLKQLIPNKEPRQFTTEDWDLVAKRAVEAVPF